MNIDWFKKNLNIYKEKQEVYIRVEAADKGKVEEIKSAITQAETGMALEILKGFNISAIENEAITLSSRYQSLQNDQLGGIISTDEYRLQANRIHQSILTLISRLEKNLEPEKGIREIKVNLRKIYQKRLKDKLADRQPINIQCAYSIDGTSTERAQIAYDDVVLEQKQVQNNLEHIFDHHRGRLLIIGDPGSGKTSLLLQLADALLKRRENRIPVILNLSTWKSTYKKFDRWLFETLPTAAAVSKAMAKSLVLEDRLLPLFDGLDEVPSEHRNSCLEAISEYGRVADHQYVICSRTIEYSETVGAPVYGQIKLLPLNQKQIIEQLEKSIQPEAKFLLHALRNQPVLAKVVENPFYFNTTQLLLSSMKSMTDLHIHADTEDEMKEELVEKFVHQQLNAPHEFDFSLDKSRRWLGFLAKKMEKNGLVVFELIDLKLGWLKDKWMYYASGILFFVAISEITIGLPQNDHSAILFGIAISTLWIIFSSRSFSAVDKLSISLSEVVKIFKKEYLLYFIYILGALVFLFLTQIFIERPFSSYLFLVYIFFIIRLIGLRSINLSVFFCLLIVRAIFTEIEIITDIDSVRITHNSMDIKTGLFFLSSSFFVRIIANGIIPIKFNKNTTPYYRIILTSVYNLLPLIFFSLFILITTLQILWKYPSLGDSGDVEFHGSLLSILFFVPFAVIFKHFLLRIIFNLQNYLPFRLVAFLNEMTSHHLFESDRGSWRFRHKIIQDYFVQQYNREQK